MASKEGGRKPSPTKIYSQHQVECLPGKAEAELVLRSASQSSIGRVNGF